MWNSPLWGIRTSTSSYCIIQLIFIIHGITPPPLKKGLWTNPFEESIDIHQLACCTLRKLLMRNPTHSLMGILKPKMQSLLYINYIFRRLGNPEPNLQFHGNLRVPPENVPPPPPEIGPWEGLIKRTICGQRYPSRWWFQIFVIFTQKKFCGNDPIWRYNMFQRGWFNHQLALDSPWISHCYITGWVSKATIFRAAFYKAVTKSSLEKKSTWWFKLWPFLGWLSDLFKG